MRPTLFGWAGAALGIGLTCAGHTTAGVTVIVLAAYLLGWASAAAETEMVRRDRDRLLRAVQSYNPDICHHCQEDILRPMGGKAPFFKPKSFDTGRAAYEPARATRPPRG
jgi:hypothetical protein